MGMFRRTVVVTLALSPLAALAQPAPTQRISGTIERVEDGTIVVRPLEGGGTFEIDLTPNVAVIAVINARLEDIKPGAFIGVGAMPQPDGNQRAIQVTILAESQRGLSEGHRPWDARPNSTMTNGTVDGRVASVEGPALTVKYKGGEKKIIVPADATILAYSPSDQSELKPGAHVALLRVTRKLNGSLEADRVNVGRGSVIPR
jgi:hypothetical protein